MPEIQTASELATWFRSLSVVERRAVADAAHDVAVNSADPVALRLARTLLGVLRLEYPDLVA